MNCIFEITGTGKRAYVGKPTCLSKSGQKMSKNGPKLDFWTNFESFRTFSKLILEFLSIFGSE